ncbi:MAG: ATP-dependent metalloprotease [Oceanospirillaceae bacterium]|jgi:cell division protease FtsH|uniref:ATP-dependent zinc metalloprotease FtsH n=1 Tax=Thalassolituus sp. TaxID=2030822 RepID=UPI000C545F5B|nr:ATP-dependent zinc metalloprotease FtsH [Thalassolituus sp.]MAG42804.1 ATP-dependent metalloprotease [Oceanospirillaceae bacterium]MEE3209341.1 ATP-dependent zinc metalloprotease FtsH [Pseudomonadota bacterium]
MAKNFVLWAVIAAVLMMVFQGLNPVDRSNSWSYSEFMKAVESGQVESVTISGQSIKGTSRGGQAFESVLPAFDDKLMDTLLVNDVEVIGEKPEKQSFLSQLLLASLPILIIIAVFMLFMRQMQGGGSGRGGPMAFGKSKAKLLSEDQIKTTFGDVAGCDEAKEDVKELVEFLREPGKYQKLGGKIPRGVLMVGQPGTGKTLLAKAIAGEARVPFFSISGSDFVEMFVGVGASRVRDMFEQAKKQAPCIIFIDEIDAVGRSRGVGIGGGNDEREQTLNQLLVEMDGFEVNDGIIVIAATNRPDVLDPALLRPGRFDRQVVVGLPDIRGREQILQVHMKKAPVADDVNASLIARGTPGFSGADLANLVNEAALFAARANRSEVTMEEFEKAKDKILMGAERKTMVMSEKEKENTAYHEAGHAIVGRLVPEHDPVYKVSIIPRGRALGVTMFLPEEDRHSISKRGIESNICSLYGGRIAEELTLGKDGVTTGASNDIERATKYARNYVTKWGLSDKLGAQLYSEDEQNGYLGSSGGGQMAHLSDDTARSIDSEVKELLDRCYQRATQILVDNRDKLEMMKDALMEYETIDSDQIDDIMSGTKPRPPKGWGDGSGGSPAMSADEPAEKESRDMASDDDDVAGEPAGERQ